MGRKGRRKEEKKGGGGRRGEGEKEKRAKKWKIENKRNRFVDAASGILSARRTGKQRRWEQNLAFNEFTLNSTALLPGLAGTKNKRGRNSPSHQSLGLAHLKKNNCQGTLALFSLGPSPLAGRCETV